MMDRSELVLLVWLFTFNSILGDQNPYCSLTKCTSEHTMCKYPDKLACPGDQSQMHVGLKQEEREVLLDAHNKLRSDIAAGKTRFPKASNMMKLSWNKEIEHIAQRWALQCVFDHDHCRDTLNNEAVGQCAAKQTLEIAPNNRQKTLIDAVNGLYAEEKFCDASDIASFQGTSKGADVIGHFTQVVWAESKELGCGYIDYPYDATWAYVHLYCNYLTTGNYQGAPVYKQGEPCSECPAGTVCSTAYEGLCTPPELDNKEVPPSDEQDNQAGKGDSGRNFRTSPLVDIFGVVLFIGASYFRGFHL